jgi:hypothetical protein
MHNEDSDDNALDVLFGDSNDELLMNDGFGDAQIQVDVLREITPIIENNEEKKKRLGGKKRKGVEKEESSSKKKKKRPRPVK